MKRSHRKFLLWTSATVLVFWANGLSQTPVGTPQPPPTLGIEQGISEFDTPDFHIKLVKASQTLAALEPKGANGFDFTPADRMEMRARDGFYHFGDITFRLRNDDGIWREFSTATARKPVLPLTAQSPDLAKADLSPTLSADCPVQVIRTWTIENGRLALHFEIINKTDKSIEIGHLGIPMIFNNIITDRKLPEAHEKCSFSDPYIGMDAGYIQVTRLKGVGPALVVVPSGKTPFEGYQLLREPMRPEQTSEGMFEWIVHTKALAEKEWAKATPWNVPTGETLPPRGKREIGVKFLLSEKIQTIEKTLAANARPVARNPRPEFAQGQGGGDPASQRPRGHRQRETRRAGIGRAAALAARRCRPGASPQEYFRAADPGRRRLQRTGQGRRVLS